MRPSHPDDLLSDAVRSALQIADNCQLGRSLCPQSEDAAEVISRAIVEYLHGETELQQVTLYLYCQSAFEIVQAETEAQTE